MKSFHYLFLQTLFLLFVDCCLHSSLMNAMKMYQPILLVYLPTINHLIFLVHFLDHFLLHFHLQLTTQKKLVFHFFTIQHYLKICYDHHYVSFKHYPKNFMIIQKSYCLQLIIETSFCLD